MLLNFLFLFILDIHVSNCERRIIDGDEVSEDKTYVVYLVKAPHSKKIYDSWLCGGALVSTQFIITSAACVEDVDYLYAIAGYNKYIKDKFIEYDDCTKTMKKKVIYTCVPVAYEFSYDEIEKWSYIDIALAKVESPYNLFDARFQIMCSYIPTIVRINFDPKHQAPGTEAIVLGWGHTEMWREHGDKVNYNQEMLRYTATLLMDKEVCKQHYKDYPELLKTIDAFMLCSLDAGHMNDKGEIISHNHTLVDSCISKTEKLMGEEGTVCDMKKKKKEEILVDYVNYPNDMTRKQMNTNDSIEKKNKKSLGLNGSFSENTHNFNENFKKGDMKYKISRRNGICQNDHGGPLIGWVGKREYIIGVASVFKIDEDNKCVGPYLYTSTACNSAFVHCTLHEEPPKVPYVKDNSRRAFCDSPPSVRGYDTIERFVSWKDHPSGPADNEKSLRSKKVKKEDKFATRIESYEDSNENNPLRDRNTQKVSFPKELSGKYKAHASFLEQIREMGKSSESKTESSEEMEVEEPLNSSSEEVVSSTDLPQTTSDPLANGPSQNIKSSSNFDPPLDTRGQDTGSAPHMRPTSEIILPQPGSAIDQQMKQSLWRPQNMGYPQNLGSSSNLGTPPNLMPAPNLGTSPSRGSSQNLGQQQNLGLPQNLGSQHNLGQHNQGRLPGLRPLQTLEDLQKFGSLQNLGRPQNPGLPQKLGSPQNLTPTQNVGPIQTLRHPSNLGPPQNLGNPQNLWRPPNQAFQQNIGIQQNLGPVPNLGPVQNLGLSNSHGFQQNLGFSSHQGLHQTLGAPPILRPPQNFKPFSKLESPQNVGLQQNLGLPSKLRPTLNMASSSYAELLKSFGSPTNLGAPNRGPSQNFITSKNRDPAGLWVPNMRGPKSETLMQSDLLKEGPKTSPSPILGNTGHENDLLNYPVATQKADITRNQLSNQQSASTNVFNNFKMRPQVPLHSS